LNPNLPPP